MLTILASLAQQESENISRNVKLGLKFRYQKGFVMVNHKKFLGYDRDVDMIRNGTAFAKELTIPPQFTDKYRQILDAVIAGIVADIKKR